MTISTYRDVCTNAGTGFNPWVSLYEILPGYGISTETAHKYMMMFHGDTPIKSDFVRLPQEIYYAVIAQTPKYDAMYKSGQTIAAEGFNPTRQFDYTDTTVHTGADTDAHTGTTTGVKTGSVADSGTDSTATGNTVTDSATTYNDSTEHETGKTVSSGTGSITHGKTTTYNNLSDTTTHGDTMTHTKGTTDTRTVQGYKDSPVLLLEKYTEFAKNNNVFMEIINDVVSAISCILYIPAKPEENEEE